VAVASAGPYATLTPFDLLQGLPPCGRHMGTTSISILSPLLNEEHTRLAGLFATLIARQS